jgi:aryl-alcohol dehydrogenase-like predicted oxidoreductase
MDHESSGMLNRRGFMAGIGGPLGALALWQGAGKSAAEQGSAGPAAPGSLIERTLGRTGLKMPVVGMGVMNASLPALVVQSYQRGVRLFDTAWFYQRGLNESMVGDMVQQLGCRDKVVIATKIFLKETNRDLYTPGIKALFLERFAQSLERLKTSYVDILYYHAASEVREIQNPPILEAFEELKKAGKVRFRGVSFHGDQAAMLADMTRSGFYDVGLVLFNAAMGDNVSGGSEPRLLAAFDAAAASGIGLVAMKTQCGGGGSWAERAKGQGAIADLNHKALLKWVLRHPFITAAIPGYTTFAQMEENVSVARDLELTADEKAFLAREKIRLAQSFCDQCGLCRGQCTRGVDVPTLMRTHMYAYGYRNLELALATHGTLAPAVGLARCEGCSECSVRCPRRLDVAGRLAGLKAITSAYA